ncbi:hypothetical protein HPB51_023567 [Rhipicephalus microplus]|uniref:Uncharacterized protein n=1 Tax=Rhipicephalus microplus TaxID=6941 RepID=A0A9J6DCR8_RHIMP|nr:hypothetical protein HPB51_023567 [Rhipicephalus microplus]
MTLPAEDIATGLRDIREWDEHLRQAPRERHCALKPAGATIIGEWRQGLLPPTQSLLPCGASTQLVYERATDDNRTVLFRLAGDGDNLATVPSAGPGFPLLSATTHTTTHRWTSSARHGSSTGDASSAHPFQERAGQSSDGLRHRRRRCDGRHHQSDGKIIRAGARCDSFGAHI